MQVFEAVSPHLWLVEKRIMYKVQCFSLTVPFNCLTVIELREVKFNLGYLLAKKIIILFALTTHVWYASTVLEQLWVQVLR